MRLRHLGMLVGIAGALVAVGAGLLVGRNEGGDRGLFVALASASFVLAAVFVLGGGGLALTRDSAWADFFPSALPARSPAQNW